ncbi:MAG: hypothetical protein IRZ07_20745, partial [Microbispora sp.]|nr:hypothetical protein [Microbispora sp.]
GYADPRYDSPEYGDSPYAEPGYDTPGYGNSGYDDSPYAGTGYGSSRYAGTGYGSSGYGGAWYDSPRSDAPASRYGTARRHDARRAHRPYAAPDSASTDDAEIGVARISGDRAELSVRRGRQTARAEARADFAQWHTITVDWLPGRVTFWLDGRQVWNYTGPYVPRSPLGLVLRNDGSGGAVYVGGVRVYRAPQQ